MEPRRTRLSALITLFVMIGCALPRRQHPVIDRYKGADCLPLLAEPRVQPPVREWDATVRTSTGSEIAISGYQAVGGREDAAVLKLALRPRRGSTR